MCRLHRRFNQVLFAALCFFAVQPFAKAAQNNEDDQAHTQQVRPSSLEPHMRIISRKTPTIAEAIRKDESLTEEMGEGRFADALSQLADLVQSNDSECKEALRIIGDAVPRTKAGVGKIILDGRSREWRKILPPPESRAWPKDTEDRARKIWEKGAAGVVRDNRLFFMAGLDPEEYLEDDGNEIQIKLDCMDSLEWDVWLYISRHDGEWHGTWRSFVNECAGEPESKPIEHLEVKTGEVVEMAFDVNDFAPPSKAKPIWTMAAYLKRYLEDGRKYYRPKTQEVPIFNETAEPGVAAIPYVRNLLYLAADVGLQKSDRIAAAIAVTASPMYSMSDDRVGEQLRRDNADLLRFARETARWQRKKRLEYRLSEYPIEALCSWADRIHVSANKKFFNWDREPAKALNSMENYRWASLSVKTLRELKDLAESEGLVSRSLEDTVHDLRLWIQHRGVRPGHIEKLLQEMYDNRNNPEVLEKLREEYRKTQHIPSSEPETIGEFLGEPLSELHVFHSGIYLQQMRLRGRWLGGCTAHSVLYRDFMKALGIAPIHFTVLPLGDSPQGHEWVGYYDPRELKWRSDEPGRSGSNRWCFTIVRIPVFTYAVQALSGGPRVKNWAAQNNLFYDRELQGREVKQLVEVEGIPARRIREFMLTPHF